MSGGAARHLVKPHRGGLARMGVYAALGIFVLLVFFPIYWMLATSLTPSPDAFRFPPRLFPENPTGENLIAVLQEPALLRHLVNSIIVATLTAIGSVLVSTYAAYSLSKFRFRGRTSLMYLFLVSQMFPQAMLLITLYIVFERLGLLDTYLALILSFTTFTLPLCIYTLKNYFDKIPTEILEAARVDGATQRTVIHSIFLPLAAPGLVSVGLFAFIRGWNDFIFALTLVSTERQTLPPGLVLIYMGEFQARWPEMMAASLLASLPVVVVFIVLQRFLIEGMTAGAVKG